MTSLHIQEILDFIPHKAPFVFVDKVLSIETQENPDGSLQVGSKVHAQKAVSYNEPFFVGHFPQYPIMPGVLLLEALAQACMFLAYKPHKPSLEVRLIGVDGVKFRQAVVPGDLVDLHVELKQVKPKFHMYKFEASAYVGAKKVVEGTFLASLKIQEKGLC